MFTLVVFFALLAIYTRQQIIKRYDELRDRYSHDLGNNLQIIQSAIELVALAENSPQVSNNILLAEEKLIEAAELINEIRSVT